LFFPGFLEQHYYQLTIGFEEVTPELPLSLVLNGQTPSYSL
jgi:hypothetical protein